MIIIFKNVMPYCCFGSTLNICWREENYFLFLALELLYCIVSTEIFILPIKDDHYIALVPNCVKIVTVLQTQGERIVRPYKNNITWEHFRCWVPFCHLRLTLVAFYNLGVAYHSRLLLVAFYFLKVTHILQVLYHVLTMTSCIFLGILQWS